MIAESVADSGTYRKDHVPPTVGGTYALVMRCHTQQAITIGRLGVLQVIPGLYVYLGSALGPGGLAARLGRHLRPLQRMHWHIDYLRPAVEIAEIWYAIGSGRCECRWAHLLAELPGASTPLPRFGSSDCTCPAHLVRLAATDLAGAWQVLALGSPGLCRLTLSHTEDDT